MIDLTGRQNKLQFILSTLFYDSKKKNDTLFKLNPLSFFILLSFMTLIVLLKSTKYDIYMKGQATFKKGCQPFASLFHITFNQITE